MKFFKPIMILSLSILASSAAPGTKSSCEPAKVNQTEIKFKSLEYSVKESEVDFQRVDREYQAELNKAVQKSYENMKKSGVNDTKAQRLYKQLQAELEQFNTRPEEDLESSVTDTFFEFLNQLNANPDFGIPFVNANYELRKAVQKEQARWLEMSKRKNQIFSKYVKAINEFHNFQKACSLGQYQAQM